MADFWGSSGHQGEPTEEPTGSMFFGAPASSVQVVATTSAGQPAQNVQNTNNFFGNLGNFATNPAPQNPQSQPTALFNPQPAQFNQGAYDANRQPPQQFQKKSTAETQQPVPQGYPQAPYNPYQYPYPYAQQYPPYQQYPGYPQPGQRPAKPDQQPKVDEIPVLLPLPKEQTLQEIVEEKKQEAISLREAVELLEESMKMQEAESYMNTMDPNYEQARIRTFNAEIAHLKKENQNLAKEAQKYKRELAKLKNEGMTQAYLHQVNLEARARDHMEKQELEVVMETGSDANPEIVAKKQQVKELHLKLGIL